MPDELPKPGPIEGGVPKVEAPQADPFAGPELPALDASAVAGLEAGGGDPSGVLEKAASGEFNPPSGYLMGEAAGGPPPTNLGAEAAAPAAASPAAPEAPATPSAASAAEKQPGGLPADHPDAPAPGFGPGGPTNREIAAGSGIDIGPKPADAPTKAPLDFDNMSDADRIGAANSADPEVRAQHKAWKDKNMVPPAPKPAASPSDSAVSSNGEPIHLSNDEINRRILGKTEPVADPLSVTAPDAAASLTTEASDLIKKVEEGGTPSVVTENLKRIARENGVEVTDDMTPNAVIEALKAKQASQTNNEGAAIDIAAASAGIDDKLRDAGAIQPPISEAQPDAKAHAESMSTQEIADELESLPAEADATPIQNERRKQLEAAWDAKFNGSPPASPDQGAATNTSEFPLGLDDAALNEMEKQGKMTPEQRAQYKAEAVKEAEKVASEKVKAAETAAREAELFKGMNPNEVEAKKNEIKENWGKGAGATWNEKDAQIAAHLGLEPTPQEVSDIAEVQKRMNDGATDLSDYEKHIRDKFGLKEKLDPTREAREMERIQLAISSGTASAEDISKYNEYKNRKAADTKDVDIRNQLREKLATRGLTKEEEAQLIRLEQSTKGQETPEQQAAQRSKEIENIATSLMLKFSRGEVPTAEEVARFQQLFAEQKMTEAGFTPDQARFAAREALKLEKGRSDRESRNTREANEAMKKLMTINLRLISQRNLAAQLRSAREKVKEDAKVARAEAEAAEPQDRMRLKGVEYGKYRQILNYNDQLAGTKYAAQRINAERIDLEQLVRRKTGVTGGLHALMEWGGAKVNNIATEVAILAEEEIPFGMGSDPGKMQRNIISRGGYS